MEDRYASKKLNERQQKLANLDRVKRLMDFKIQLLSKKLKKRGFDEFKRQSLDCFEYVVENSMKFVASLSEKNSELTNLSEENPELIQEKGQLLSELAFKMEEQRDQLEKEDFVNAMGAFKIATVIPNRGDEFRFQTCFRYEDAFNVAHYQVLKKELVTDELKLGDASAYMVLFLARRAWILKTKKNDLLPPFEFP